MSRIPVIKGGRLEALSKGDTMYAQGIDEVQYAAFGLGNAETIIVVVLLLLVFGVLYGIIGVLWMFAKGYVERTKAMKGK